ARQLPGASGMGIELHLGAGAPRADFLVRLTRAEVERGIGVASPALAQPGWRPLRTFLEAWAAPGDALTGVENLWLEVDLGTAYRMASAPSLFFDLAGRLAPEGQVALAQAALRALGRVPDEATHAELARCAALAAPELRLHYIGLMLSRAAEGL